MARALYASNLSREALDSRAVGCIRCGFSGDNKIESRKYKMANSERPKHHVIYLLFSILGLLFPHETDLSAEKAQACAGARFPGAFCKHDRPAPSGPKAAQRPLAALHIDAEETQSRARKLLALHRPSCAATARYALLPRGPRSSSRHPRAQVRLRGLKKGLAFSRGEESHQATLSRSGPNHNLEEA